MRTTLTLDDDLAGILQKRAQQQARSFKEVVNDLLRAGIEAQSAGSLERKQIQISAKPLGLRAGYDPDKMNQLADELEAEEFIKKQAPK